jgi:UDP-glucose 4-epimerase
MTAAAPGTRVVVLGHSGFVGQHLMRLFQARLPKDVAVVGRSWPAVDLTQDSSLEILAADLDPQTVLVVCAGIKRQWGDTLEIFQQNLKLAVNLHRLLKQAPVRRVLFFSSAAVYGEELNNLAITEETPVEPTSLYGLAKYASEGLLRQAVRGGEGAPALVILRPALIYGPGDQSSGYGPSGFVRSALVGEPIVLWGDGSERRGFMFVADVAEVVWRLAFHDFAGIVNLTGPESCSFRDVLDCVGRHASHPLEVTSRPRSKPQVDHVFMSARLQALCPDLAFTPLEKGIGLTYSVARDWPGS